MSVEEYRQKMELYIMRASIREEETTTMLEYMAFKQEGGQGGELFERDFRKLLKV